MGYGRFAAMIATSTVVMFGLMYLNTYALDHVFYSQTRTWMAVVMGAVMALIMIGFMWGMYPRKGTNAAIVAAGVVVFAGALWLVRSQETVHDVAYMKAMIPHHSIAIMTSERAHIATRGSASSPTASWRRRSARSGRWSASSPTRGQPARRRRTGPAAADARGRHRGRQLSEGKDADMSTTIADGSTAPQAR